MTVCSQDLPYPKSTLIKGIEFDWSTHRRHAQGSDNFQLTWADDDHQYGFWGDGNGFAEKFRVSLGLARIEGDHSNYKGVDRYGHKETSEAEALIKGKSWGIISVEGVLYSWIHPDKPEGWGDWRYHNMESKLYMSEDKGAMWIPADWAFKKEDNLTGGNILQYSKDHEGSKYVYHYMVHPETDSTELQVPGRIYLLRVPRNELMNRNAYEFFSGMKGKKPIWTGNINDKKPVFTDKNGTGTPIGISYNKGLKRYILSVEHGKAHSGMHGIFEAPNPWGPWSTVTYAADETWFGRDNSTAIPRNCFFWCIPVKWISNDGRSATMVFTGGGRGLNNDSFNTVRISLVDSLKVLK